MSAQILRPRFTRMAAVRFIDRTERATLYDFCAYRAALLAEPCADDLAFLADAIEKRVAEIRKAVEAGL